MSSMLAEAMSLGHELLTAVRELTAELRANRAPARTEISEAGGVVGRRCRGVERGDERCQLCTLPMDNHPVTFSGGVPVDWKGKQT